MTPFRDHEVLEYILFSLIPRKDVNELAHNLIEKFGSFANVLDASYDELREVKNMTDNAALYLSTLPAIFTKYQISKNQEKPQLNTRGAITSYAKTRIGNSPNEVFLLICMDVKKQVLRCTPYTSNSRDSVDFSIKELVAEVVKCGAYYVATAHNHPSGDPSPSINDVNFAKEFKKTLDVLDIKYVDNIIIARKGNLSFADEQAKRQKQKALREGSYSPEPYVDFSVLYDDED